MSQVPAHARWPLWSTRFSLVCLHDKHPSLNGPGVLCQCVCVCVCVVLSCEGY